MKKAMQYASMFDIAVISHCEDTDLAEDGVMNEGYTSTVLASEAYRLPPKRRWWPVN